MHAFELGSICNSEPWPITHALRVSLNVRNYSDHYDVYLIWCTVWFSCRVIVWPEEELAFAINCIESYYVTTTQCAVFIIELEGAFAPGEWKRNSRPRILMRKNRYLTSTLIIYYATVSVASDVEGVNLC